MGNPYIPDALRMMGHVDGWADSLPANRQPAVVRIGRVGHQVVDQGLPPYAELALSGKVFTLSPGVIANGVIPVADVPTTASMYSLWNGNPEGSNIFLLPIKIFAHAASGTLGLGTSLIAGLPGTAQAAAVANSAGVVGPGSHNPASGNSSNAKLATGITLAAAPAWADLAGYQAAAAVSVGAGLVADVWGMYAIPPKFALGTHILAPVGTAAKFSIGVQYAEVRVIFP